MKIMGIIIISVVSLFSLLILLFYIRSRRPVRFALINAILGVLAFAAINLTARFTGVHIPINIYTLPGAGVFGIPAVAAFVLLQIIME